MLNVLCLEYLVHDRAPSTRPVQTNVHHHGPPPRINAALHQWSIRSATEWQQKENPVIRQLSGETPGAIAAEPLINSDDGLAVPPCFQIGGRWRQPARWRAYPQRPPVPNFRKVTQQDNKTGGSHALKVAAKVILVKIAVLNLLGHLPLALTSLLGILQFEAVLVHGETHSLVWVLVRFDTGDRTRR